MEILKSQELLLIVPHFKVFIKDQAALIRSYFGSMTILIPVPFFATMVTKLPFFNTYFDFLKLTTESTNEHMQDCKMISANFFTLPLEVLRKRNSYLATRSCVRALSKDATNFDIIHAHFLGNGLIGASLKNLYDKPLVVTAHGSDVYDVPLRDSWCSILARYVLSEADQVITVSQSNAEKLLLLGVSSDKLHVIPNGYNERLFKPIPSDLIRKKLALPFNKRIILSVGNLVDIKGHTYLIDAMSIVLKKEADVILVILGSGPLMERLRKKVDKLGLNGRILLLGRRPHDEIPMWMNASDIFVLPSLGEGFPTVIPEALACGKPVIGTRVGGVPEALADPNVGILVDSRDSLALANAILTALKKKWQTEIIVNYAKRYSWGKIVEKILEIYQAV